MAQKWHIQDLKDGRWALLKHGVAVFVGSNPECAERWKALIVGEYSDRDRQDATLRRAIYR